MKSHFSSKQVDSTMAARLSVPYCVAIALVDGAVGQKQFQSDRFQDARVRRVLDRTEVVADAELTELYPEKFPARVVVTMRGGEILQAEMMYPKGDPQNPLSNDELAQKFRDNARDSLSADGTEKFISGAMNLGVAPTLADLTRPLRVQG